MVIAIRIIDIDSVGNFESDIGVDIDSDVMCYGVL